MEMNCKKSVQNNKTISRYLEGLTKDDSQAVKGIAIWLMLFHHLFYKTEQAQGMSVEFLLDADIVMSLAVFAKICVSLFVFITAYGLAIKYKELGRGVSTHITKITIKRYFGLMFPFQLIFALVQIICNIVGIQTFAEVYGIGNEKVLYFLFDALGLANCLGTPTLNATWWYMSLALLLIFIMPFIYGCVMRVGICLLFGFFIFVHIMGWTSVGYMNYILVAILAVTVCEMGLFQKIAQGLQENRFLQLIVFIL